MNTLIRQIFNNKEAAALPGLLEGGGLPALVSGLSAVHRANLAAALRLETGRPIFIICPDDTAAESFARDMRSMLGEECGTLIMRDYTFYAAEAASRQTEQRRLAALYQLAVGKADVQHRSDDLHDRADVLFGHTQTPFSFLRRRQFR